VPRGSRCVMRFQVVTRFHVCHEVPGVRFQVCYEVPGVSRGSMFQVCHEVPSAS
jgi:hypothetical protein